MTSRIPIYMLICINGLLKIIEQLSSYLSQKREFKTAVTFEPMKIMTFCKNQFIQLNEFFNLKLKTICIILVL